MYGLIGAPVLAASSFTSIGAAADAVKRNVTQPRRKTIRRREIMGEGLRAESKRIRNGDPQTNSENPPAVQDWDSGVAGVASKREQAGRRDGVGAGGSVCGGSPFSKERSRARLG